MITPQESQLLDSYWIEKHNSGIIQLVLNVHSKSLYTHQSNVTTYIISNLDEDNGNCSLCCHLPNIEEIVSIPEIEALFEPNIQYHEEDSICKDQRTFWWIPISLLGHQKLQDKILQKYYAKMNEN